MIWLIVTIIKYDEKVACNIKSCDVKPKNNKQNLSESHTYKNNYLFERFFIH